MRTFCNTYKKGSILTILTVICLLFSSITAFADEPDLEKGPGITPTVVEAAIPEGTPLGVFKTTGYCNCEKCSGGHNLTYSGTVPQAEHTISADLDVLPLGTKVRIGDIIYTVEDIGSSVNGKKIDIYYASHEEAVAHGLQEAEVFLIEKPSDKTETPVADTPAPASEIPGPGGVSESSVSVKVVDSPQ